MSEQESKTKKIIRDLSNKIDELLEHIENHDPLHWKGLNNIV